MFYICNGTINLLTTTHTFLQWFQNINNEKGEKSKIIHCYIYIHIYKCMVKWTT